MDRHSRANGQISILAWRETVRLPITQVLLTMYEKGATLSEQTSPVTMLRFNSLANFEHSVLRLECRQLTNTHGPAVQAVNATSD